MPTETFMKSKEFNDKETTMKKYKNTRIWSFILLFIGCALMETFSYFRIDGLFVLPGCCLYVAGMMYEAGMMGESSIDEEVAAKHKSTNDKVQGMEP